MVKLIITLLCYTLIGTGVAIVTELSDIVPWDPDEERFIFLSLLIGVAWPIYIWFVIGGLINKKVVRYFKTREIIKAEKEAEINEIMKDL